MSPRSYQLGQREAAVAQTRERILAAARALFVEAGFHGASLEEVARRADVARKTVYYQFGSKQGLLEAVVADIEQRAEIVMRVQSIIDQPDASQALPAYLLEVCRFWEGAKEIMRTLHGLAALDPDVAVVLVSRDAARRARLVGFVDRIAAQQGLKSEQSQRRLLEGLWMLTSFNTFDHLVGRSRLSIDEATAILTQLANGLLDLADDEITHH